MFHVKHQSLRRILLVRNIPAVSRETTSGDAFGSSADMRQNQCQCRRSYAVQTSRLTEGSGPDSAEFLSDFRREPSNRRIIYIGRQSEVLITAECQNVSILSIQISGILRVYFQLLDDRRRN